MENGRSDHQYWFELLVNGLTSHGSALHLPDPTSTGEESPEKVNSLQSKFTSKRKSCLGCSPSRRIERRKRKTTTAILSWHIRQSHRESALGILDTAIRNISSQSVVGRVGSDCVGTLNEQTRPGLTRQVTSHGQYLSLSSHCTQEVPNCEQ